mgnify:CR=1 FL=1
MRMENRIALRIDGITKEFPGVRALDDVSFEIRQGTVHALIGENGAGKSTLIKILAGIYVPDRGRILLEGEEKRFKSPREAQDAGISVVHQEIKLAETLTAAENIFLGRLLYTRWGLVDWKAMYRASREMIENLGMDILVDTPVERLTVARKQIVEICKAIHMKSKILIMDEPSATLTEKELKVLFHIVRKLRKEGYTIIYISHRLEEIFDLADDITVLRDGRHIRTAAIGDITREELIRLMVGREMGNEFPKEFYPIGEPLLEVSHLSTKGFLKDISFQVKKGEVLGISGLVGAGRTELARAILGIDRVESGEIRYKGVKSNWKNFRKSIRAGLGLVPEDRKQQGLVQIFSVKENVCMVAADKVMEKGIVREKKKEEYGREYINKLNIAAPGTETEVRYLSGGNQQKVVIAKWLMQDSELLFLDEPTRGIDVGAKVEIYKLINELVKKRKTIIMISSEMPELLGMCDRILVMHEGKLMGELSREEASQERIMEMCV